MKRRAAFDRALAVDVRSAATWTDRAVSLLQLGRASDALAACERSIGVDPKFAMARFWKAAAEERLGRPGEAVKSYQQFLAFASLLQGAQIRMAQQRIAALRAGPS